MNCQEVTEYMQRQLDDDLNGEETEILMTHTRHCPDCAAMMERLQLLHDGLENLPKVTPSYSLVDAILPRLAELDLKDEDEATLAEPAKVYRFDEGVQRGASKRKWTNRYSVSAIAAVAAVVIVFFLFNNNANHQIFDNSGDATVADSSASTNSSMNTSDAATDDSAADQKTLMTESTAADSAATSADDSSSNSTTTSSNAVKKSGAPESRHVDPDGETMPPLALSDSTNDAPTANASAPNVEESGGSGDTASAGSDSKSDGSAQAGSIASTSDSSSIAAVDSDTSSTGSDKAADNQAGGANSSDDKNLENNYMANTVIASPISPNQQYQAFIVEDRVEIYTVQDSVLVFQSKPHAGIANLKWSQDSKELTYETKDSDGTKRMFAVEVKSASEQEQSSKN